ncbi:hypothetical protein BWK59_05555 [Flavobacterium davisii]|uniref:Uncharacterized protein n=1 Tax=Flavobacterium davisii TaxID=2906077 RepID=A0A246GJD1_9FLAO|nr:hypothetical protein [Flavobacterium davisii]OWP84394.1 hypothetical protein BWK59_05555 [Flavobacterium davisii]
MKLFLQIFVLLLTWFNYHAKGFAQEQWNNSTGTASIFPMLTATETEELVAIAFANPNKIWANQTWESEIFFKGKKLTVQGYGIQGNGLEADELRTGWVSKIE